MTFDLDKLNLLLSTFKKINGRKPTKIHLGTETHKEVLSLSSNSLEEDGTWSNGMHLVQRLGLTPVFVEEKDFLWMS